MSSEDHQKHNSLAWDEESREQSEWCTPVSEQVIEKARAGRPPLKLTPNRYVPISWLEGIGGRDVLCAGSGGGQQAPILAAYGCVVTSLDSSPEQLNKDLLVAEREGLEIKTVHGDMSDLSMFPEASFDLVVNAVSNIFVPDVKTVWREFHRVLKQGGVLITGFMNPAFFMFDHKKAGEEGVLMVEYQLPYSDVDSLDKDRLQRIIDDQVPLVWSHSIEDQIGGQIEAGFVVTGLYEDRWSDQATLLNKYSPTTIVTRSVKS